MAARRNARPVETTLAAHREPFIGDFEPFIGLRLPSTRFELQ
jgi:hypothetical protein